MKPFQQFLCLLFFSFSSTTLVAQFKGGSSDGVALATAINQALGRNIFLGGIDDGISMSQANAQPFGRNIFLGGTDDGISMTQANAQALGRNIFLGGVDDGISMSQANAQALGRNIFLGGVDDGISMTQANAQPLGRNIFLGGSNDGWAMAMGTAQGSLLPVTLSEFSGQWDNYDARLWWKTSAESNTSHFELERSTDGGTFTRFATIAAAGQSTTERSYQYIDSNRKRLLPIAITTVYYRLRTVDIDGKDSYSGIVVLRVDRSGILHYSLYPNPAKDVVTVSITGSTAPANATIFVADAGGRVLINQRMTTSRGQVNVSKLPAGTYFLQIIENNQTLYTQKIIIHK